MVAGCGGAESPAAATVTPEPAATLASAETPTPVPSPSPTATASPTGTPSPTFTPEPSPTFTPPIVILPTVPVPTLTPTPESGPGSDTKLDAIGLRVNVLRGLSTERPIARELVTKGELANHLRFQLEEDRQDFEEMQQLYVTLGVVDRQADLYDLFLTLYGAGVLGLYDDEEEKLYIVLDDGEFGPVQARTYAHEYVHGLQQQHYDIRGKREALESNSDGRRALRALVEGDAYLADNLYTGQHMEPAEQEFSIGEPGQDLIDALTSAPRVVQMEYLFAPELGTRFAIALYQQAGWEGIDQAFQNVPQSTEQVLHPDKYAAGEQPVVVEIPDLVRALGDGWTHVADDTIGEFMIFGYLSTDFPAPQAAAAATGWGGDRFSLLKGPQSESLVVSRMVWDTADDAQEFFATFVEFTEARTGQKWESPDGDAHVRRMTLADQSIHASRNDVETLLVFAPDQSSLEAVTGVLLESGVSQE